MLGRSETSRAGWWWSWWSWWGIQLGRRVVFAHAAGLGKTGVEPECVHTSEKGGKILSWNGVVNSERGRCSPFPALGSSQNC
jgi:hypothetical protein